MAPSQEGATEGLFNVFRPGTGWIVALILFVLLIFRDVARDTLKKGLTTLVSKLERRLSGYRVVRARSIRRYRDAVTERLASVPVPFQLPEEIPMSNVYIPLRASDAPTTSQTDASVDLAREVRSNRSVIVLGPPGSGKSLFLRYVAWSMCAASAGRDAILPVIVPLSRVAESSSPISDEIAASLEDYGFTSAQNFVNAELQKSEPRLLVLLDGFDEVATSRRGHVAALIEKFADSYPDTRIILTCRTAVYGGTFDGIADAIFHVQEFSDELIDRFLYSWPSITSHSAVDRLVAALHDTPRVAALARNPLLLTMLAYLYASEYGESVNLLPRNRTHFYRDATDLLLRRWHKKHNQFRWMDKKVILQHLAYVYQTRSTDRREMEYTEILDVITRVLPRVNLEPSAASNILTEIVERSGLLNAIDNGERFQFAHLSLQEYFVASELLDRADELLKLFTADPTSWREPIKLWCGGEHDSTDVVRAVAESDKVLALECLADATRVDEDLASAIISSMQDVIERARPEDPVVQAFGTLAADHRPRGQRTFRYLARSSVNPALRLTMASALASSNLPQAAEVVADLAAQDDALTHLLVGMGNLALPALERRATEGDVLAVVSLGAVGTPAAAQVLSRLVWHDQEAVQYHASLELTQLLGAPGVEQAVAETKDRASDVSSATHGWVWVPFTARQTESERITLQSVLGRVFELLQRVKLTDVDELTRSVEFRIAAAVLLFDNSGAPRNVELRLSDESLDELLTEMEAAPPSRKTSRRSLDDPAVPPATAESFATAESLFSVRRRTTIAGLIDTMDGDAKSEAIEMVGQRLLIDGEAGSPYARLFLKSTDMRVPLLLEILRRQSPETGPVHPHGARESRGRGNWRRHWATMCDPHSFDVDGSWYNRLITGLMFLVALTLCGYGATSLGDASGWTGVITWASTIALGAACIYLLAVPWQEVAILTPWSNFQDMTLCLFFSPALVGEQLLAGIDIADYSSGLVMAPFTPALLFLGFNALSSMLPALGAVAVIAGIASILGILVAVAMMRQRRAVNPLRPMFQA